MSNFTNIITKELKTLYTDMIDALLEDGALTTKCTVVYEATKFDTCPNCFYDVLGGKSNNRYKPGGPIPFYQGVCPMCNGNSKVFTTESDDIYLMCIFDSKSFIITSSVKASNIYMQTLSKISTYSLLNKCSYLTISDSNIQGNINLKLTKAESPTPLGWGGKDYILTSWKQ